ncbi:hypothetical protein [Lolliginicoccus lacisalsi]|uniref:hypothetical protein n=1 Tax=Lolliginicoccus lacisalsi TaxID=2742202 RepID=UPI001CDC0CC5|nr:hypothetical protein [Lolliginicoccus lacisalsi]
MPFPGPRATHWWCWAGPAHVMLLVSVMLLPLWRPGYLLHRDAVATPRSYVTDTALGVAGSAPRAVPPDWLLALLSRWVDGGVLVTVMLSLFLLAAGWGAIALVQLWWGPGSGRAGSEIVAATLAVWNPYVVERLLQGHWSLLAGYGALPWIIVAAARIHRRAPGGFPLLVVSMAVAGLTPTGAVVAVVAACAGLIAFPPPRVARAVGALVSISLVVGSPWLTAAVMAGQPGTSDAAGVAAFAARAETGLGTLGSLVSLGGIWNSGAVPASRAAGLGVLATTWIVLIVLASGRMLLGRRARGPFPSGPVPSGPAAAPRRASVVLAILAAAAVLGPALAATGPGLRAMEVVVALPGGGLLRDTHKWVALAVPFLVLCAAAATRWLAQAWAPRAAPAVLVVMLVAVLPDAAWGAGGALRPVQYPAEWAAVAEHLEGASGPGDVAVLPAGLLRQYPYAPGPVVLDPAARMLPRDVVMTSDLPVGGTVVRGEDSRARAVEAVLLGGGPSRELAALGVRWVIDQPTAPGRRGEAAAVLATLPIVVAGPDVVLHEVPGPIATAERDSMAYRTVLVAHVAWLALLAAGAVLLAGAAAGRAGARSGSGSARIGKR